MKENRYKEYLKNMVILLESEKLIIEIMIYGYNWRPHEYQILIKLLKNRINKPLNN